MGGSDATRDRLVGRGILKAIAKRKLPAGLPTPPPTAKQVEVEHERELWGPNPIPGHTEAEDLLYLHGERFLMVLYGAVFGVDTKGKQFKKALGDGPFKGPIGWGDLAKLYQAGGDPAKMVSAWEGVIDKLITQLIPATSTEQVAGAWAVRTVLLGKIGEKAATGSWPTFESLLPTLESREQDILHWTQQRALIYAKGMTEKARAAVRDEFVTAASEGLPAAKLQQRLFDRFSVQNRDWRRVVLTETAGAVQNARLASVDPADGWEAVWTAGPKACPFCKKQDGRRFKLIDPKDQLKADGQNAIWVGKSNVGRASSLYRKDGTKRTPAELWWICIPAHPLCCCQWTLVRAKKPAAPKAPVAVGV